MSVGLATRAFDLEEPIPGYRLKDRIGAGGYGEVWKAEAPGGIAKAVKIVFGRHDDERAARELTSLNRIKEVRHPFLLSVERIELVDGHLIIVTELAAKSMANLFEEYREAGARGIPRDLLLAHLRDVADALDYIRDEHNLQHLDIKPENLLLVGGRVKVADFGVVKDLEDTRCSSMGGLTPVYAPPELFDGRPSVHSDQYSLAIVFQELLSGSLPFNGRTTAQLAAQHLHGRPNFDGLPGPDQVTIGRALSKNPEQRYTSCRELIDTLMAGKPREVTPASALAPSQSRNEPLAPTKTVVLSPSAIQAGGETHGIQNARTLPTEAPPCVRDLPPLPTLSEAIEYRPTIFVGIGGIAALALQSTRRRLTDRFGDLRHAPAIQTLLFDTDAKTLSSVTEGEGEALLPNDSAILLPLRESGEYRRDGDDPMHWLSRRWLFNIPRSLQTQGFRPLGRLAFVDHLKRVKERLTATISLATRSDSIEQTTRSTKLPFRSGPPRIFILASISGGTGSGMALDIGYLTRSILRQLELPEGDVVGLLAYASGRLPRARDLCVASAYAFLTELRQFMEGRTAYPGTGSGAAEIPAFGPRETPFDHAYLAYLGEELEEDGFQAAASQLAEYAHGASLTPAARFFDRCRSEEERIEEATNERATVRTFGLSQPGVSREAAPNELANELCLRLLKRWRSRSPGESDATEAMLDSPCSLFDDRFSGPTNEEIQDRVAKQAQSRALDVASLFGELHSVVTKVMSEGPDEYLQKALEALTRNYQSRPHQEKKLPTPEVILRALDTLTRPSDSRETTRACLESTLDKSVEAFAAEHAAKLREWIQEFVAAPNQGLRVAQRTAEAVTERLRAISRTAQETFQARRRQLRTFEAETSGEKGSNRPLLRNSSFGWKKRLVLDPKLSTYFRGRIEEIAFDGVNRLVSLVLAEITALQDQLRNLAADLNRLIEEFQGTKTPPLANGAVRVEPEFTSAELDELLAEIEANLEVESRKIATSPESYTRRVLPGALRRAARSAILRKRKKAALAKLAAPSGESRPNSDVSLANSRRDAIPLLSSCGGARRLLMVAPEDAPIADWIARLGDDLPQPPTVVTSSEQDCWLCYEAEQLPLRRVAAAILDGRYRNVEAAARLHARIDIDWSPL